MKFYEFELRLNNLTLDFEQKKKKSLPYFSLVDNILRLLFLLKINYSYFAPFIII